MFESTLKFLLLNEDELLGNYIKSLIDSNNDECIELQDFADLNSYCIKELPDMILIDLNLKKINAFKLASKLKKECPKFKIAFLADYEDKILHNKANELGVEAFIPKENLFEIYNRLKVTL